MTKTLDQITQSGFMSKLSTKLRPLLYAGIASAGLYIAGCGPGNATTPGNGDKDCVTDCGTTPAVAQVDNTSVIPQVGAYHNYDIGQDIAVGMDVPADAEECGWEMKQASTVIKSASEPCTPGNTYTDMITTGDLPTGTYDLEIIASADGKTPSSVTVSPVTLNTPNTPPVIDGFLVLTGYVGSGFAVDMSGYDPEGENINSNWSLTSTLPGAFLNPGGTVRAAAPDTSMIGNTYNFTVSVEDSQGLSDSLSFSLVVDPLETKATVVYDTASQTNQTLTFDLSNAEADKLGQNITELPAYPAPVADDTDGSADIGIPYQTNDATDLANIKSAWNTTVDKSLVGQYNQDWNTKLVTLDDLMNDQNGHTLKLFEIDATYHGN